MKEYMEDEKEIESEIGRERYVGIREKYVNKGRKNRKRRIWERDGGGQEMIAKGLDAEEM